MKATAAQREWNHVKSGQPHPPQPPAVSWWIGLSREAFTDRHKRETPRMTTVTTSYGKKQEEI